MQNLTIRGVYYDAISIGGSAHEPKIYDVAPILPDATRDFDGRSRGVGNQMTHVSADEFGLDCYACSSYDPSR